MSDVYGLQVFDVNGNITLDTSKARLLKIIGEDSMTKAHGVVLQKKRIDIPELLTTLDFWLAITKVTNVYDPENSMHVVTYEVFPGYVEISLSVNPFGLPVEQITIDFLYGVY